MRVLVVEDEPKVANAVKEGLEGERYEVVVEHTGEGAFFRLTTETFDVILLDLTLPGATASRSSGRSAIADWIHPCSSSPRATRSRTA